MTRNKLTPRIVVRRAADAIAFYERAFGAKTIERYEDESGHLVHAAIDIDGVIIAITGEKAAWQNHSPEALEGSPVLLNLVVDDVDTVGKRLLTAGATEVFPIADQFYGHREGRFRDPFGHLWIITTIVEVLSPAEIEARMKG